MHDKDRPLTPAGEESFRQTARMLARVTRKPQAILTSPFLRSQQTAALAAQAWGHLRPVVVPALVKGDWSAICRTLATYDSEVTVALVGHENWLSTVTARFLASRSHRAFDYRKGGVALIEAEHPKTYQGTLLWFIPPRVFQRLK